MPEGPSILYLANQLKAFEGRIVTAAGGYGKMPTDWLKRKKLLHIKTWGKHLLLEFNTGTVRVHLMLFGDVLINERKKVNASFYIHFGKDEVNGYVVKAEKLEGPPEEFYDWRTDILHKSFSAAWVVKLMQQHSAKPIHEVLMNQDIFTGVGNKIRNEALYRAGIHPFSITAAIPSAKQKRLVSEVRKYARIFYKELQKHGTNKSFGVYQQEFAADGSEVTLMILKKEKRKLYVSESRQKLYQ